MNESPSAAPLLVDFGGVLTESMHDAFVGLAHDLGLPSELPLRLLSTDDRARTALVEHERGRLDDEGFEAAYAAVLREHGADVPAEGLIARLAANLGRDERMLDLLARLRERGHPVALVSNSLGRDCYAGVDLHAIADVVVISGQEGVRKPSRRIFQIACDRLGVDTHDAVLIDDVQVNLDGAARLGIAGVLHRSAAETEQALAALLDGDPTRGQGAAS